MLTPDMIDALVFSGGIAATALTCAVVTELPAVRKFKEKIKADLDEDYVPGPLRPPVKKEEKNETV